MEIISKSRIFKKSSLGSLLLTDLTDEIENTLLVEYDLYKRYYKTMRDIIDDYNIGFAEYLTKYPEILNTYKIGSLNVASDLAIIGITYLQGGDYDFMIAEEWGNIDDAMQDYLDDYEDLIDYSYQNSNLDKYREKYGNAEADIMKALITIAEDQKGEALM